MTVKLEKILITAYNIDDLVRDVDLRTSEKHMGCSANEAAKDYENGKFKYVTRCPRSKNAWTQKLHFEDWEYIKENLLEENNEKTLTDVDYSELLNQDVKVDCDCPAFRYFYRYTLDQLDSSIDPESRYPHVTNDGLEGTVCKHLLAVFKRFFL